MSNHYKRWTEEEIDMVVSMRVKDLPIRSIAKAMGRTEHSVHCLLTRQKERLMRALAAANVKTTLQERARPGFLARIFGWL